METKVQQFTLEDGRRAERHIVVGPDGSETIEIFAEEQRPLRLEKRVLREMKQVVAKETHQIIKDGEVSFEEVVGREPEVPLHIQSRIATVAHDKPDSAYVRMDQIQELVAESVVAGVSALMKDNRMAPVQPEPFFKAQSTELKAQAQVEKNVEEKKKKSDVYVNVFFGVLIIVQIAGVAAYFLL